MLEGWCPAIRWADKAVHSDFIHTVAGAPLYFETTDNFADLRQRFFDVIQRCRQVMKWPAEAGAELGGGPGDFRQGGFREGAQRSGATPHYLDKHFGMNQITSYGVTAYEELRPQVEDRQVRNVEVKALGEQRRQNRAAQSRLLLLQTKGEHQERQRQPRIQALEKQPETDPPNKEGVRLRQGQRRWESSRVARQEQIQKLSGELAQLELNAQPTRPSRGWNR